MEACADRLWIVKNKTVTPYDGDLQQYRTECLSERGNKSNKEKSNSSDNENSAVSKQEQRRLAAEKRALLAPMKKKVTQFEKEMEKLQTKIKKLDEQLSDVSLYEKSPDKAQELTKERGQISKDLETIEMEWMEALEEYEEAQGDVG